MVRGGAGAAVVAVVLGSLYVGGMTWTVLVSVLALVSLGEFYSMLSRKFKISRGVGFLAGGLILFTASDGIHPISLVLTLSITAFVILFVEILRRQIKGELCHLEYGRHPGGHPVHHHPMDLHDPAPAASLRSHPPFLHVSLHMVL
jgi:hypothetical protein